MKTLLFLRQDYNMYKLALELFYNDGKRVKKDKLKNKLGISIKTIQNYMVIIEDILKDLVKFDQTSKLIKADFSMNIGAKTIKKFFIKNSLISQIIIYCFINQPQSKEELAKALSTSDSSIYRNIKNFNQAIKDIYNIKFSYTDLDFLGDEFYIQKFYLNLFINTQTKPNSRPFAKYISHKDATTVANIIGKYVNNEFIFGQYSYVKTALAISIIRYKMGKRIELDSYDDKNLRKIKDAFKSYPGLRLIFNKIFPNYAGDEVKLVYDIIAFFFTKLYIPFSQNFDELFKTAPAYQDYHSYFKGKISYLCDKYKIGISNIDEIYKEVFSFFYVKSFNVDQGDFFIEKSDYFLDYVKFINIDFYRDLKEIMEEFLENFPKLKKIYTVEAMVYATYSTWPSLLDQLLTNTKPQKAIIISNYDGSYARLLRDFINAAVPLVIKADIYKKPFLDIDWLAKSDYDVIIADFLMEENFDGKLVLNIENLPKSNRASKILCKILGERLSKIKNENKDIL